MPPARGSLQSRRGESKAGMGLGDHGEGTLRLALPGCSVTWLQSQVPGRSLVLPKVLFPYLREGLSFILVLKF